MSAGCYGSWEPALIESGNVRKKVEKMCRLKYSEMNMPGTLNPNQKHIIQEQNPAPRSAFPASRRYLMYNQLADL